MGAVTYPNDQVRAFLAESFVLYQINILERHPDFKEASNGGRVMWGPTFVLLDSRGSEVRRWVGWLPPESFIAELRFSLALAAFNSGQFDVASTGFTEVATKYANSEIHAEALYWQGIAGFLAGNKDWAALKEAWQACADQYPGTRFGTHASVIEDAPD